MAKHKVRCEITTDSKGKFKEMTCKRDGCLLALIVALAAVVAACL